MSQVSVCGGLDSVYRPFSVSVKRNFNYCPSMQKAPCALYFSPSNRALSTVYAPSLHCGFCAAVVKLLHYSLSPLQQILKLTKSFKCCCSGVNAGGRGRVCVNVSYGSALCVHRFAVTASLTWIHSALLQWDWAMTTFGANCWPPISTTKSTTLASLLSRLDFIL